MSIWVTLHSTVEDKYVHEAMSVAWKHVTCNSMFMGAHMDGDGREELSRAQSGCHVWRESKLCWRAGNTEPCWPLCVSHLVREPPAVPPASCSVPQVLEHSCFVCCVVTMEMSCLRNPTLVYIRLWQNWFPYGSCCVKSQKLLTISEDLQQMLPSWKVNVKMKIELLESCIFPGTSPRPATGGDYTCNQWNASGPTMLHQFSWGVRLIANLLY